jgi:hypothetical protein
VPVPCWANLRARARARAVPWRADMIIGNAMAYPYITVVCIDTKSVERQREMLGVCCCVVASVTKNIAKAAVKSAAKCITRRISCCWGGGQNEQEAEGRRFQVKIEVNVV